VSGKKRRIPLSIPQMTGDEWPRVKRCFEDNWVSTAGPDITEFGSAFARYLGAAHAVPLSSGTAALHLALRVLGVKPGDSVFVSSLTFIASVNPIAYCGAEPVFIDSERRTFNMDPEKAVRKLEGHIAKGRKPAALILVHLYGHAAEAAPILEACREHGVPVIEDATEALGTEYRGKKAGTIADVGCFSFNGNKLMTTGGGGMLVTGHEALASKAAYLSTQAKDDPKLYIHNDIGYNYRLTNIQAAMGLGQLAHIEEFLARKRVIAGKYRAAFDGVPGLTPTPELEWCRNCFWLNTLLVDESRFGMGSRELADRLEADGIECRPFWKPIHTMPMYSHCDAEGVEQASWIWERALNIPSSTGLSEEDQERVISAVLAAAARSGA